MNPNLFQAILVIAFVAIVLACAWLTIRKRACVEFSNIAEGVHEGQVTRLADGAIATRYLLVKKGSDGNHVTPCTAITDRPLGVVTDECGAAEDEVNVALLGSAKSTLRMVSGAAIVSGALIATMANGKVQTAVATQYPVGVALQDAAGADEIIEVDPRAAYAAI
jgi:hypothetical protein